MIGQVWLEGKELPSANNLGPHVLWTVNGNYLEIGACYALLYNITHWRT